jgi:protein phosphatase
MGTHVADHLSSLRHAALTDVGMRRTNNQDNHAVVLAGDSQEWRERGHLFLVADGMGAHAAGELASKLAADEVSHNYLKHRDLSPPEALRAAIREANTLIHDRGESNLEFKGMGTTCSTLVLLPQGAVVGHVGDSRVYRLRKSRLEQLSFDHSLVWELRSAGDFSDAETIHLPKNIITRSLGPNASVEVDLEGPFPLEVGDTFLMCSDGLTGEVKDDELGVILECLPPNEAVRVLVDLANLRGGPDNITALVVRVEGPELTQGAPTTQSAPAAGSMIPTLFWLLAGTFFAVGIGSTLTGYLPMMLGSGLAAVACGILAILLRSPHTPGNPSPSAAPIPLGSGPHTSRQCTANSRMVADLSTLAQGLRDAANNPNWSVDWQPFENDTRLAAEAAEAKDYVAAVRHNCHAISFMMNQLRSQGQRR